MKQLIIIMLTMFSLNFANAQSHNPGPNSNCKLNKNYRPNIEKISCPACDLNDKKEKTAIEAEDKRRSDVIVAKAKAEKEALDKAYKDKLALDAKKAETAGKVFVDVKPSAAVISKKPEIKSNLKYMINSWDCMFLDSLNQKIVQMPSSCRVSLPINRISYLKPKLELFQYGFVSFNGTEVKASTGYTCNDIFYYNNIDLVDYSGKRQFNNKYINEIHHINDGWFMISIDSSDIYYKKEHHDQLYNIFTEKTIPLKRNWDWGTWVIGYCDNFDHDADRYNASQHFIPIFPDNVVFANTGINEMDNSIHLKKMLLKYHPDVLTEKVLNEYSIVLFVTGSIAMNYGGDSFLKNKPRTGSGEHGYPGGYHGLLLISKNGTIKKIDL